MKKRNHRKNSSPVWGTLVEKMARGGNARSLLLGEIRALEQRISAIGSSLSVGEVNEEFATLIGRRKDLKGRLAALRG